uniref:fructose-bisphosphatase n=1 Tax=Dunaliella tertiolecta TaxID=3047 RepID=A0A7S3QQ82_DUNTE|mmetsp:Transcript_2227/g.5703  ORF Transcript_2227/g.5703 Transcript_2227/m.5703 type:complete len:307 (+) Transcript_2227:22-942(+)
MLAPSQCSGCAHTRPSNLAPVNSALATRPCRRGILPSKPSLQISCLAPLFPAHPLKLWTAKSVGRVTASAMAQAPMQPGAEEQRGVTMNQFLTWSGAPAQMILLMQALQTATKIIASKVASAGVEGLGDKLGAGADSGDRDAQKKLDVVANEVLKTALAASNVVGVMASEEDDEPCIVDGQDSSKHVVVFDPLDGSSNIAASIPTGTIVGVYARKGEDAAQDVLQPGEQQVAAAYSLYSSATMMVISVGSGTHGFTLLPTIGEFILTHPNISIPARGQMYSLNDARQHDWPAGKLHLKALCSCKSA